MDLEKPSNEIHRERLEVLNHAFSPGWPIYEAAKAMVGTDTELSPAEVADIIAPPTVPGESTVRWQLQADAPEQKKAIIAAHQPEILQTAGILTMRRDQTVELGELEEKIDPKNAVWVVEGGGNKTSVVRRELGAQAMRLLYRANVDTQTMFQFGSGSRMIERTWGGLDNPEFKVAGDITGRYMPDGDSFSEFELNIATAKQAGYRVGRTVPVGDEAPSVEAITYADKSYYPFLMMVQPNITTEGALQSGLTALHEQFFKKSGGLAARQLVIVSNGQYRPKDEAQAAEWADDHDVELDSVVALGDEPGFAVDHANDTLVTLERSALAYAQEMAILYRLLTRAA